MSKCYYFCELFFKKNDKTTKIYNKYKEMNNKYIK